MMSEIAGGANLPVGSFVRVTEPGDVAPYFARYTEDEIVRFDPADANAAAQAQKVIYDSDLPDEEKCFAHFWSGYFYAYASRSDGS